MYSTLSKSGPLDTAILDSAIEQRLARLLLSGQADDMRHVGLSVRGGVVTVIGRVERAESLARIERFCRGVPGVRSVLNEVRLEAAPAQQRRVG